MFRPFRVTVPCSTSNVGPGFDCLGLALERFLQIEVRPIIGKSPGAIQWLPPEGTLAELPLDGEERITRALLHFANLKNRAIPAASIFASSTIPVARGLGSSGSATVAGLAAACELLQIERDTDLLFDAGCKLEGHPDNIGPALMGGCVVGMPSPDGGKVVWFRAPVHTDLRIAVAVPKTRVETARARTVLPETVNFTVARDQPRRLAQLLQGLATAEKRYLQIGAFDELHTPFRAPLIPNCYEVMNAAIRAGAYAAAISGSGSAILAIGTVHLPMQQIAGAMQNAFAAVNEPAETFISQIPAEGYKIEYL
ncbi:MAG: homoserine kinase [Planctomycetota bacterium]